MSIHLRVLVVEDSEDDMLLVLRQLRRGGYSLEYVRVETPEEMQTALDRQPWDVVIADYTLPTFSAPEALTLLQRNQQDLPFIIVSGTIGEETAVAAMKAGAHDYITKPKLARLVPAVERELREAEERQKRKQAERALRESEERFRQLVENMIETVFWITDPKMSQMLYVSPAYEQIWGRSCESLYANLEEWFEAIHPDDQSRIRRNYVEQTLAGTYDEEYRITRLDGSVRWIHDRGFPIRDASGMAYRTVGIATDITERKQLEAQFYQAQRLESLGTLAGGIAHDLNNVLTPILTIAQLLRIQQPELNARSQEMLQVLEDSARRGANMVRQILTFTRGTGGERTPVNVASLLQEAAKVAQQTFPKLIKISAIVPAQGIRLVSADATQLHQVLMNLCVNARDAMSKGGTLTLAVENFDANAIFAQMNLDAQVGPYVLITVTDTGMGIAPEVRDRIFEPFFTTKSLSQGTGLGLSTVLGIVRSYGGFVQVASEVGKGTQFKVYLPAIETDAASNLQETPLPQGQGELILVVDDEDCILQTTRAILETYHYQVLTASSGSKAIAIYAQHQQDIAVVLVDMMMPDMDGIMVIRKLQEMNPQVRVIAASGLLSQYQNGLEALGIKIRLNKPYTTEDLLTSVQLRLRPGAYV